MKVLKFLAWSVAVPAVMSMSAARAADVVPSLIDGKLGVQLARISFSETLPRDLASGFENRLLIRVTLMSQSNLLARADALLTVKYDLWDEQYVVTRRVGTHPASTVVVKIVSEVTADLAGLKLDGLFETRGLPQDQECVLRVELLMNPIERERIERLREWVAANSVPADAVSGGATYSPKPNDLFNRIFDQYTRGADVAAPWRATLVSQPFRLYRMGAGARGP